MKTKNNVQKAISQSTARVIGLVLLAFSVNAQGSSNDFLANNPGGKWIESSSVKAEEYLSSEKMVHEMEPSLELEKWMFVHPGYAAFSIGYEEEVELPLELEDWMMKDNRLSTFEQEEEAPLKIEDWMFSSELSAF